jgi:signal transduction histidine kinase
VCDDKLHKNYFCNSRILKIKERNIMKKNLLKLFVGLAAFLMIMSLTETNYAQRRGRAQGYSKQRIEQLLERLEERTDTFSNQFNKALDRSRLDGRKIEDRYTKVATILENATDELRREFDFGDTRGETKQNARKVLNAATDVNRILNKRNFGGQTETSWVRLRNELNLLAKIYNLPAIGAKAYK